ncbi:MAG: ribosomal protein S18-alanine N-acetyltransferase [Candidatus Syntrophosphaera sp.]|nr:ribosomal protein S18-alanine N-acetyltransferase [Candidatus Syntrophosphaera sp.]
MSDIRKMTNADLPDVLRIENLCFSTPWPEEAFELTPFTDAWVTCIESLLRGYIMYHTVLDESVIINFAIDPACQRQGLGTQLLGHTLEEMAGRSVRNFYLDVRVSNIAAQNLYHKFGFLPLGFRKNYYSAPEEDSVVMVKHA